MSKTSFRDRKKAVSDMTTAFAVQDQVHGWLDQLVLELKHEHKTKGALGLIAEEAGLPFSKVRCIFYRLTKNICAWERDRLEYAIERIADLQAARVEARVNNLRSLRDKRRLVERHFDLPV